MEEKHFDFKFDGDGKYPMVKTILEANAKMTLTTGFHPNILRVNSKDAPRLSEETKIASVCWLEVQETDDVEVGTGRLISQYDENET